MPIELESSFWESTWTHELGVGGEIKAAILAAGLGRRMEPLTVRHLPKPLFPLGGKVPITEVWVRRLVESGITDISMNLCVLADLIKRHFKDGTKFAADIRFLQEQTPSGTFGGVCKQVLGENMMLLEGEDPSTVLPPFQGSTVIVPSGDVVTNFGAAQLQEMYQIHRQVGAAVTMVLVPVPWDRRRDFGTVILEKTEPRSGSISSAGRIQEFREKDPDSPSNLCNASIYMIERDVLADLAPLRTPADPGLESPFYDFGKHVFPALLGKLPYAHPGREYPLWAIQYDGEWFDVGQKRDYIRVNQFLLDGDLDIPLPYEELVWGYLGNNVSIDFGSVTIRPPVLLGNDCVIERGAVLGPHAIVGDGWVVERGAEISRSVLWQRCPHAHHNGPDAPIRTDTGNDRCTIGPKARVAGCIVVGGKIEQEVRDQTVEEREDGSLSIMPIDYVPQGERA